MIADDAFSIFFTIVLRVTSDRFPTSEAEVGGIICIATGDVITRGVLRDVLVFMLNADAIVIASRGQLSVTKIITVILNVCTASGLVAVE